MCDFWQLLTAFGLGAAAWGLLLRWWEGYWVQRRIMSYKIDRSFGWSVMGATWRSLFVRVRRYAYPPKIREKLRREQEAEHSREYTP